jgi:thioredoxin-like negative regulator of GroEL
MAQLQLIVNADPDDFDSASKLAVKLEAAGRETDAIPILDRLATREVYNRIVRSQIRSKVAALYVKKGDKAAAASEYRKALELNPKNTAAEVGLAQLEKKP